MKDPADSLADDASRRPHFSLRSAFRVVLVLGASMLLAFMGGELVSRWKWAVPLEERLPLMEVRAHPTRGFEMVPDSDHYTYQERVHVNHLGLRGPDLADDSHAREDPGEGGRELRVLALGDSFVYGQGAAENQTIPAHLERILGQRLSSAGRHCRVINGGVRAYNTRQELALLEELGPRLHPDIVVLFWFANDLENPDIDSLRKNLEISGPIVFDVGSKLEGVALWQWRGKQLLRHSAFLMRLHDAWADRHYHRSSAKEIGDAWRRLDDDLARFAALGKEQGFDCFVAVIPAANDLDNPSAGQNPAPRVNELAVRHEIPCIDLFPPLVAFVHRLGRLPTLPYDGHYDGTANAAIAAEVASHLGEFFEKRLHTSR